MDSRPKGALQVLGIGLAVIFVAALTQTIWKPIIRNEWRRFRHENTGTFPVRVVASDFIGNWMFRSPEMARQISNSKLSVSFNIDHSSQRISRILSGEYDVAIVPLHSVLREGEPADYPLRIIGVICKSTGADAVLAKSSLISGNNPRELDNEKLSVVYPANSQAEFVVDVMRIRGNLFRFLSKPESRISVEGSERVLERALNGSGDLFAIADPHLAVAVSQAKNLREVYSSAAVPDLFVQVIVVHRSFIEEHPREIAQYFAAYFDTVKFYGAEESQRSTDLQDVSNLSPEQMAAALSRFQVLDFSANYNLFHGIERNNGTKAPEGMTRLIANTAQVLLKSGRIKAVPVTSNLVNSSFVEARFRGGDRDFVAPPPAQTSSNSKAVVTPKDEPPTRNSPKTVAAATKTLSDAEWGRLQKIGEPMVLSWSDGGSELSEQMKVQLDSFVQRTLARYPTSRLSIRGHTGKGSEESNKRISAARAQAVQQFLVKKYRLESERIQVRAMGASSPPPKRVNEYEREYLRRWSRVEIQLLGAAE